MCTLRQKYAHVLSKNVFDLGHIQLWQELSDGDYHVRRKFLESVNFLADLNPATVQERTNYKYQGPRCCVSKSRLR